MTTDRDNPVQDPKLSAAWREHSAEMPPAELDAAILAAGHRAVGSAPLGSTQRAAAGTQSLHATRPQRWWMPLAAAATIGAVALGILQTVPEDSPTVTDMRAPAVSDMPAATSPPASAPRDMLALEERKDAPRAQAESAPQQAGSSGAPPAAAPVNRPATPPATVAAKPAEKVIGQLGADSLRTSVPPPAAAPQPFPAEPKRDSDESGRANERASRTLAAPPSAPPTSEFQRRKETTAQTDAKAAAEAPPLARSPPPAATPAPERMAAASDDKRQRNEIAQSAPAASGAVLAKKAASAEPDAARSDFAKAEAAKQIDVDAWIVRIRKLHDDGKLADAAKELVALRAAVPDADRRLPPELRAWAATVKP